MNATIRAGAGPSPTTMCSPCPQLVAQCSPTFAWPSRATVGVMDRQAHLRDGQRVERQVYAA